MAYDRFMEEYGAKWLRAIECLAKDKDVLFIFYDFPVEHWTHLRTTNPIESSFATVRHRTRQTKGCGSRLAPNCAHCGASLGPSLTGLMPQTCWGDSYLPGARQVPPISGQYESD